MAGARWMTRNPIRAIHRRLGAGRHLLRHGQRLRGRAQRAGARPRAGGPPLQGRDRHEVQHRIRRNHAPGVRGPTSRRRASAPRARTPCDGWRQTTLTCTSSTTTDIHGREAPARCAKRWRSSCAQGKIRAYGWSTDFADRARGFARERTAPPSSSISTCWTTTRRYRRVREEQPGGDQPRPARHGPADGKYTASTRPAADDVRGEKSPQWMKYFKNGAPNPEWLAETGCRPRDPHQRREDRGAGRASAGCGLEATGPFRSPVSAR